MPPTLTVSAVSGPAGTGVVVVGAVVVGAVVVVLCAPATVPPSVAIAAVRTTPATVHLTGAPRRVPVMSEP